MDIITDPGNVPSGGYVSRVTGSWEGLKIGTLDPEKWNFPPVARKILHEGMEEQLVSFLHAEQCNVGIPGILNHLEWSSSRRVRAN